MLGRVSRCTISGNHFLRDDTITPVPCPTGPQMQPITPQVGVTMGNSSSDVLITGNVFRGMMQMAVCVNSSGALLIQTLSAHLSPFAQPFWPFIPHLSLSLSIDPSSTPIGVPSRRDRRLLGRANLQQHH